MSLLVSCQGIVHKAVKGPFLFDRNPGSRRITGARIRIRRNNYTLYHDRFASQKNEGFFTNLLGSIGACFYVGEMFDMIVITPLYASTSSTISTVVTFEPVPIRLIVDLLKLSKIGGYNSRRRRLP